MSIEILDIEDYDIVAPEIVQAYFDLLRRDTYPTHMGSIITPPAPVISYYTWGDGLTDGMFS